MARYRVAEATQVNIDGQVYGPGEVLEVVPEDIVALLARGVVVEAQQTKAKPLRKP